MLAATTLIVSGCAGDGKGLDQNGELLPPPTPAPVAAFTVIQDTVFTPICSVCHGNPGAAGLNLTANSSYAMLVGVTSVQVPALLRVKAGDPAASYLIHKLEGTQTIGQRMPRGGPFLSEETINFIRQWISDGAPMPVNASVTVSDKKEAIGLPPRGLAVVVTSPTADELLTVPPAQLIVGFDRQLDSTLVNDTTVTLERAQSEPSMSLRVAIHLFVPESNRSTLVVTPASPLPAGDYTLRLRGSGGGALAGLDAVPLQMRDPYHGGRDYTLTFTVEVSR
jgi:hypothetical protein